MAENPKQGHEYFNVKKSLDRCPVADDVQNTGNEKQSANPVMQTELGTVWYIKKL
jgi:hypothetical protein